MRRAFASEAEFDAWHANAKTALGMPIVGVNAATGLPAPKKQQTTGLTALDENGEAVITDDTLAARGFQDALIRADLLTADEIAALANQYPAWELDTRYEVNDLRAHAGTLWKCVQAHTSQSDWQPPDVPALWTRAAPAGVIPEWVQPTGAHDAYQTGDEVTHPDRANTMGEGASTVWVWRSKINANTTEPGQDGTFHRWWEPVRAA